MDDEAVCSFDDDDDDVDRGGGARRGDLKILN